MFKLTTDNLQLTTKSLKVALVAVLATVLFAAYAFATIDPMYIGVGARPLGMGKAYVAVAEDGDTIFMNPAGLGRITSPKLTSMYASLLGDIRYVVLGGAYPTPYGAIGAGAVTTNVADIHLYDGSGTSTGLADYGNNVYFLSYGATVMKDLQLGASLKYFSQGGSGDVSLEAGTGQGMDMDLGILYTPMSWLSLGYTQTNLLASKVEFKGSGVKEDIPSIAKLGMKVAVFGQDGLFQLRSIYGGGWQRLNLAVDYDMSADDKVAGAGHAGLEYYPIKYFALRVGVDQSPAPEGVVTDMTAGVGLRWGGVEFNYAYHPYDGITENATHFFSISYVGPEEKEKVEEKPVVKEEPTEVNLDVKLIDPPDRTIFRESTLEVNGVVENIVPGTSMKVNQEDVRINDVGDFTTMMKTNSYGKMLVKAAATGPDGKTVDAKSRLLRLVSFNDVTGDYWARAAIEYAGTVGLVEGYPDGGFKPERALSRAEFAALLVRAKGLELPIVSRSVFPDVPASHWASRYLAAALQAGLVQGYPDGSFRPNNKISRAEGVMVIGRFEGLPESSEPSVQPYSDIPADHWAGKMISAAKQADFLDYIKGKTFAPRSDFPRSEAVYVMAKTTLAKNKIDWLLDWNKGYTEEEINKDEHPEDVGANNSTPPVPVNVAPPSNSVFSDVPESNWAAKAINDLSAAGVVSGFPDGTFKPDKTMNRGEISTLLVKAEGIEPENIYQAPFNDVSKNYWAAKYIKRAVLLGFIQGYSDGTFKPNKIVTRAETVAIIDRFDSIYVPDSVFERPFPDVHENNWAAKFILGAKDAGILEFLDGKYFEPDRPVTRAEVASMLAKTKFGKDKIDQIKTTTPSGTGSSGRYTISDKLKGQF